MRSHSRGGYCDAVPSFFRRLIGVGKLPDRLRNEFEPEGIIDLANNVAVVCRFSGSVPGLHSSASTFRTAGALVFTSHRVVATLAIRSDPAARAVDCTWDATEPRPMKIEISGDGVMLDLDVHRVDRRFQGHLSLHYKHHITTDVLARLPRTSLRQDVSAEFVCRALGVRGA
jgi:hypothetical protein